MIIVDVSFPF